MQEEFREEYRKANDSVHVPEELMERTVKAVRTEERRQKTTYFWKYAAMAACVCIVCFGGWKLTMGDRLHRPQFLRNVPLFFHLYCLFWRLETDDG